VLHEALDSRTPLLERAKFLAIFGSNLDEFFMKRVERLRRGDGLADSDGFQHLNRIREAVLPLASAQSQAFREIRSELAQHGIRLLDWDELNDAQRQASVAYFRRNLFPVLTPLAVDPGHPFPFISNLSTSLGMYLTSPDSEERSFARVKVPEVLPRWVPLPSGDGKAGTGSFVRLQDILRHNLDELFHGMAVNEVMSFRVTRDADVETDEDEMSQDLVALVEGGTRTPRPKN
jgi:polyphosphate kinase